MDRARRLALAKAQAVAARHPDAVVIGSDQVAASQGRVLDKPGDAARTFTQLGVLELAAGAVLHRRGRAGYCRCCGRWCTWTRPRVQLRALSTPEIERYVAREQPFDCAGGFKAEALGITLFESIESLDPTALIGLPLIWLAGALRAAGYLLP